MRATTFAALIVAAFTANLAFSRAKALGINCRGSSRCTGSNADLYRLINDNIPLNREYNNNEHIACDGNMCAFFQDTHTAFSGGAVHQLIESLYGHCDHNSCGSVPTGYPWNNDPKQNGILTVNYVSDPDCKGVC
ncbi:hypothetical protein MMC14_001841 [Varicellaria rhodocarpa]|nr:hypothetical protein [Varicellaria rhodocarpa]